MCTATAAATTAAATASSLGVVEGLRLSQVCPVRPVANTLYFTVTSWTKSMDTLLYEPQSKFI